jgi:hypothetical protein
MKETMKRQTKKDYDLQDDDNNPQGRGLDRERKEADLKTETQQRNLSFHRMYM